jgi:D-tyrosyl-tRNA(Tyr) deacylase
VRAVVQRVSAARVTVAGEVVGQIGPGLLVYAAAAADDSDDDIRYVADKIAHLRIFRDEQDKLNRCVLDVGGGVLHADARKGRRPSLDSSASGELAEPLMARLAEELRRLGLPVNTGRFGAYMQVESVNDGPICVLLDSRRAF